MDRLQMKKNGCHPTQGQELGLKRKTEETGESRKANTQTHSTKPTAIIRVSRMDGGTITVSINYGNIYDASVTDFFFYLTV